MATIMIQRVIVLRLGLQNNGLSYPLMQCLGANANNGGTWEGSNHRQKREGYGEGREEMK